MPTYEYRCEGCGHDFERFQKMSDDPVSVCPKCGESKVVRRISSGGGFVFKGPGFYATDYRKSPPPSEKSGSSEGGSDASGASTSGGSDSGGSKPSRSKSSGSDSGGSESSGSDSNGGSRE